MDIVATPSVVEAAATALSPLLSERPLPAMSSDLNGSNSSNNRNMFTSAQPSGTMRVGETDRRDADVANFVQRVQTTAAAGGS